MPHTNLSLPKGTVIPDHIALILDGNRRWARARGLSPWRGHAAGYEAVKKLARTARELGVHTFTIWAFSTENWERPQVEIDEIFKLLRRGLKEFEKEAHEEKVRLVHIGRKDRFPDDISNMIVEMENSTRKYPKNILNLALDYGGRDEIIRATKQIVIDGIDPNKITEKLFETYLDTNDQPYPNPDLFIRTSGEQRTSGLLPWQMSYAEYYFESENLPDFTPEKLKEAVLDYSRRRRRFGKDDVAEHFDFNPEVVAKFELDWWRLGKIPEGMKFREYAVNHLKEQFGLSKTLASQAAKYLFEALVEEKKSKWIKAASKLKKFYELIRDEVKLAFEPKIVASMEVRMRQENGEGEAATTEYLAEVYRISLFQAAKAAHLRVLANIERNLAERGMGEKHWDKAHDYLEKYYHALKERVA